MTRIASSTDKKEVITMMEKKRIAYCPFCASYEEFDVTHVDYQANVRGERFPCQKHVARCRKCGEEVFVQEIADQDLVLAFETYKKRVGLLTAEEIRRFRKSKGLSATRLAKILGLGEKTITRFETGDIQSKAVDTSIRLFMLCYDLPQLDASNEKSFAKSIKEATSSCGTL